MHANVVGASVGILYPGELGCHLARLLREQGHRVVTTLEGRSPRTHRLAGDTPLEILGSTREVLETARVVLSVVPPVAAVAVARHCASLLPRGPERVFVDVNSIAPDTVGLVEAELAPTGVRFVDGAVHGMATQLRERGTLYLSGAAAAEVAALFGTALRVRVLGEQSGRASAFKMLISGLAKGTVALVLEMALAARRAGLLDELLACYRAAYPGIMALAERQLPTYPQHAARRGDELGEVEQTFRSLGLESSIIAGARSLTAAVGRLDLAAQGPPSGASEWTAAEVIEAVFARNPLTISPTPGGAGLAPRPDVFPGT
jgi:3-hydroxyisobutyrate dehydrogenase-like beta-hydroxyacid dehydrogenase